MAVSIKPVVLEPFLKDPSYVDNGRFGTQWLNDKRFGKRNEVFDELYGTLEVMYFIEDEASYYVWVVVPSELRGATYDVVIHFYTDKNSIISESNLKNYNIQIFSNNPVMGYYFGFANFTKGLFIPNLCSKFEKEMLTQKAVQLNPRADVGFDHSFYHAGKYLLSQARFLNKSWIGSRAMQYDQDKLEKLIRHIDQTMAEFRTIKDKSKNRERFNNNNIFEKTKGVFDNAKAKIGEGIDKVKGAFNDDDKDKRKKDARAVRKITAKKSNAEHSAVHKIKPRKKSK